MLRNITCLLDWLVGWLVDRYRLHPYGSQSKIERIDTHTIHELYGSSEITIGTLFRYRKFDDAMTAFLRCLKELIDHVELHDTRVGSLICQLPYTHTHTHTPPSVSMEIQTNITSLPQAVSNALPFG
jgi:hypothetical protein